MAPGGQAARAGLKAAVSVWACSGGSGQGSGPSLVAGRWQGCGGVGKWRRESKRRQAKHTWWHEPSEQGGGPRDAVPQATLAFPQDLLGPREVPDPISPTCDSPMPLTLFSSLWAVFLGLMWPGGFFLQAVAAPPLWFPAHSPWQPLCQPHQWKAWGTVGHLGCGGVLAAEGVAVGRRGLGWAPSVVAGLWGWLPGQELCSGDVSQTVVALWVGLEPDVCLKRKLGWAGVLSTGVSPKGRGGCSASHGSGRGAADRWMDKLPLAQLMY